MDQTLAYCTTLLRKDFVNFCGKRLQSMGLTLGQLYCVLYVGQHPLCAPKSMNQALSLDAGQGARMLAKLMKEGFLVKTLNPRDRRAHQLELTNRGRAAFDVSHELFAAWDEEALKDMKAEEREMLLTLMRRLCQNRQASDGSRLEAEQCP